MHISRKCMASTWPAKCTVCDTCGAVPKDSKHNESILVPSPLPRYPCYTQKMGEPSIWSCIIERRWGKVQTTSQVKGHWSLGATSREQHMLPYHCHVNEMWSIVTLYCLFIADRMQRVQKWQFVDDDWPTFRSHLASYPGCRRRGKSSLVPIPRTCFNISRIPYLFE